MIFDSNFIGQTPHQFMIISTKRIQSHKRTGSANTRSRQKTLIPLENFLIPMSLFPNTIVSLSKNGVWYVWKYDFKLARPLRYPRSAFLGCDGGNEALITSGACKSVIACAKSTILTRTSGEYFIPLSSSKEWIRLVLRHHIKIVMMLRITDTVGSSGQLLLPHTH